jgi:HPt (histidine-containing phosphotransfer) domain-containing protein
MTEPSAAIVDFDFLESFAAGDMQVITEVLQLFQGQADIWRAKLADPGDGWRDVAHTIKGASRGIGANRLGDAAERAEQGDLSLAGEVRALLDETVAEIEGYLTRIGGG